MPKYTLGSAQEKPQEQPQQQEGGTDLLRHGVRTLARSAESVAGLPGDIASGVLGIGNYLSNGTIPNYQQASESLGGFVPPTSEQLKQFTNKATGGYTESKGSGEQFYDDIISDIATLAVPLKGRIPLLKAAKTAVAGNVASKAVEELGGGPLAQAASKFGIMTLAGLRGGRKALEGIKQESYAASKQMATGKFIKASDLKSTLNNHIEELGSGITTPRKEFMEEVYRNVNRKIQGGRAEVSEIQEALKDVNSLFPDAKKVGAYGDMKRLNGILNGTLEKYGLQHPEYWANFKRAQDIQKGLFRSQQTSDFLREKINPNKIFTNPIAKALVFGSGYKLGGIPGAAASGAIASQGISGIETLKFITESKEALKHYQQMLHAAAVQNIPAMTRHAIKLNNSANRYQQQTAR